MIVVIDTSSLLSLVRYYLPFDQNGKLLGLIKREIINHNIMVIDEVLKECNFVSGKLVVKKIDFLADKEFLKANKIPINTENLIPPSPTKFYNLVDNTFITTNAKRLDSAQFEQQKKEFLDSADARMIIYLLNQKSDNSFENIILVTEETEGSNDMKAFEKLPAICKILDIDVKTLPELLELYSDINISFE
ncbi:MAG TPA: DUF4411 domain-containing protein [Bacteroidales bacterium]|nr:MAG: hypothetical protein A2W98_11605 [Bacteroidetes bacterium GWF2_33_38]OFY75542.1 MAG: hypothetical protein A2265_03090 [Bacteroidetes bacterium RIFOXYA12_FULL_33_9]OFY88845.1 MAG: hypothetical protein A2236_08535 [Bacteroidetes bacterium RIFOXYA2_FULL_33_7]HBF89394.1 DUF4411 domain-containing protein [Bacteroidales bacterium]